MKINLLSRFLLLCFSSVIASSAFVTAQTQEWAARYNSTGNQPDYASLLHVDAAGNSYVAGSSYDSTGGLQERMAVVKYDVLGNQIWVALDTVYSGAAYAMTVDPMGDVFLTGYDNNYSGSSYDVLKFDSNGVFQWIKYIGVGIQDQGDAITSDSNYVYVTGGVLPNVPPWTNYRTVKLDIATGTTQTGWPQDYNGTGNNQDIPRSIAVDASGNVFVTGSSINGSGDKDFVTIGYAANGNMLSGWPARFDGPQNGDDTPTQILLSGSNVYVTGICNQGPASSSDTTGDICTIVYDYSGNIVSGWPQIYNGPGNSWDGVGQSPPGSALSPMAVDASGNVYVGGWSKNALENYDMITFKYNAAGVIQSGFPAIYDNGGNDDIIRGLALDASNDIIVTGWTAPFNTFTNGNYVTIEYDNAGNMMNGWPVMYNGTGNGDDQAMAVAAVGKDIWVTGYSNGSVGFEDFETIKYSNSNTTVGVKDASVANNSVVVFPNPSTGRFTINNTLEKSQLTITNVLGEVIYVSDINTSQAQVDLSKEAKGIYFYQLVAENKFIASGKMIVQ